MNDKELRKKRLPGDKKEKSERVEPRICAEKSKDDHMRLKKIEVKDILPVKSFCVDDLSDIVVIAGPNGVGKTRLINGLLGFFQKPRTNPNIHLIVQATSDEERTDWGKEVLDTAIPEEVGKLKATLQKNKWRTKWRSSIINFESDRTIQKIAPYEFSWTIPDPDEEEIGWSTTFGGLKSRFRDTLHSIFRKVHSRRDRIASRAEKLMKEGKKVMDLDYPDPLEPFKDAFSQLLSPKKLLHADPKRQQLNYEYEGQKFPMTTLSSGEGEVVNIVFDFILRHPSDNIVMFDEPELHLHPELSYKLLQTLSTIGKNNQFIFCTHSPDIITASLDNSVVFIAPSTEQSTNQAFTVEEDDETNKALKMLGQSIGIISLGKKIVLVEGANSSLDKQVYGAILKNRFPNLVLVPSGGKDIIRSFASIYNHVLERTIWGVEFFMLCDQDVILPSKRITELEAEAKGRLKILKRYHLENYFLDEAILARIFSQMVPTESWLASARCIREKLKEIAHSMISYSTALTVSAYLRNEVGNLTAMPKGCDNKEKDELAGLIKGLSDSEAKRINRILEETKVRQLTERIFDDLKKTLDEDTDDWKRLIPGRALLNQFARKAQMPVGRLKTLFLREAEQCHPNPFADVIDCFEHFDNFTSTEAVDDSLDIDLGSNEERG